MFSRLRSLSLGSTKSTTKKEEIPQEMAGDEHEEKKPDQVSDNEQDEISDTESHLEEEDHEESDNEAAEEEEEAPPKKSRSRSRSLGRMFRRKGKKDRKEDAEDDNASVASSVKKIGRSRSLSSPMKLLRSKSFRSKSFGSEPKNDAKAKGKSSLFRRRRKKDKKPKQALEGPDSEAEHESGEEYHDDEEKKKKRRLSSGAKVIMRKLSISKGFRLKKFKSKKAEQAKSEQPEDDHDSERETDAGLEDDSLFSQHFTRSDLIYFKSIANKCGDSMYGTLSELIGEENELLLARLGEMLESQSDLYRALAALRSTKLPERLSLLYEMHDLQATGKGCTRDDLRAILRFTVNMEILAREISPQSVKIEDADPKDVNRLRLEKFYLENAPGKLNRIATILDKYTGKEDVLWRKLEKQYFGVSIPTEIDIWPVLGMMPTIEELVDNAFSFCPSGADHMPFSAFVRWIKSLSNPREDEEWEDSFMAETNWRENCREPSPRPQELSGWLRIATLDSQKNRKKGQRKIRISELSWRRRWCTTSYNSNGTADLRISKSQYDKEACITINLSEQTTQIDSIERKTHKHRWTMVLNHKVFIQASRASSETFDDWLCNLRASTHPASFPLGDHEDDEQEDDDHLTTTDDEQSVRTEVSEKNMLDMKQVATQIQAFYALENPEKLDTVDNILLKYKGRERVLMKMLVRQYPGSSIPTYEEAKLILAEQEVDLLYASVSESEEDRGGNSSSATKEDWISGSEIEEVLPDEEDEDDDDDEEVMQETYHQMEDDSESGGEEEDPESSGADSEMMILNDEDDSEY